MRRFGELEAVIMDRLWERGRPMLVREMVDALHDDRALAYTTVMTVMENLHRKGWLRRERDGRAWRYEPTGSRSSYTAALMNDALATSPDRRTALTHFALQMSPHDAALLREALDQALGEPKAARKAGVRPASPGDRRRGAGGVRGLSRHPGVQDARPGQVDGPGAAAGHRHLPGRRLVGHRRARAGRPDAGRSCDRPRRGAESPDRSLRAPAPATYGTPGGATVAGLGLTLAGAVAARTALTAMAHFRAAGRQALRHAQTARLVGQPEPALGAVLVEHAQPAAYCVAGRQPTVVLTTGAVQALDPGQLDAVLAHERAHLTGRHHRLLALARIGREVLPFLPLMRDAEEQVARLVELHADDAATRARDPRLLATALVVLATRRQSRAGPRRGRHRLGPADPPAAGTQRAAGARAAAAAPRHRRGARPDPGAAGPDPSRDRTRPGKASGRLAFAADPAERQRETPFADLGPAVWLARSTRATAAGI